MTNIEIVKSKKNGSYLRISVYGHSGYSKKGSDIVCSAISFITINTVNSLLQLTEDKPKIRQDEEQALIRMDFDKAPSKEGDLLLRSFELGMKQIADKNGSYGDYVNLTIKEV